MTHQPIHRRAGRSLQRFGRSLVSSSQELARRAQRHGVDLAHGESRWTPILRVFSGLIGGVLAVGGLVRRDVIGLGLSALGLGYFAPRSVPPRKRAEKPSIYETGPSPTTRQPGAGIVEEAVAKAQSQATALESRPLAAVDSL
jgi:hypothetical protein